MPRILVADDEELERKALRLILQEGGDGVEVVEAANGREAAELARAGGLDAAFLDVNMPGLDGIGAARLIRGERPDTPIVFLTAHERFDYAREALRLGVDEYLLKPASAEEVRAALERALRNGRARRAAPEFLARGLRSSLAAGSLAEEAWAEYRSLAAPGAAAPGPRLALAFRLEPASHPGAQPAEIAAAALGRVAALAERLLAARGLVALAGAGPERALAFAEAAAGAAPFQALALATELRERARADLGLGLLAGAACGAGAGEPAAERGAARAAAAAESLCGSALGAAALARPERPLVITRCATESPAAPSPAGPARASRGASSRAVERARNMMSARLGEELSLESVAAELRLSPSHLSRLFALESGAGFGDCLARMRIDRAKGLLSAGSSVKEAAALVGYRDPAYFARVFRRLEGESPGEYLGSLP